MVETSRYVSPVSVGTMRAAVLVEPHRFDVQSVPRPAPGAGEVLVRLEGCGVCASNLPPFEGREWFTYPMDPGALGHEGWGTVEALGEGVTNRRLGQRVAMLSEHAYAEFDVAPVEATIPIPDALAGKPFPGEPLGCATNIFHRSGIRAGDTVAIVGIGFLGALLVQLATKAGARVIAIGRRPFALEFAQQFGADVITPMDDHWRLLEEVKGLTDGRFCDVVIECVGKQWPLDLAGELTRERGRLVVAGYHQDGPRQVNMQLWNWRGIDVINAHERERQAYLDGIEEAMRLVEAGTLDPFPLFTHRYPLERLTEALDATHERMDGFMKALIELEGKVTLR